MSSSWKPLNPEPAAETSAAHGQIAGGVGGDSALAARRAYDAFAASYDDFNHRYMYERWTARLLEVARGVGMRGCRLLDVGCGTGLSFVALLDRGWEVTACDISPAMVELARSRCRQFNLPCECAYRCNPYGLYTLGSLFSRGYTVEVFQHDGCHQGIRLAASCRSVDQAAFTAQKRVPGLKLEGKRFPSLVAEPSLGGVEVLEC